MKEIVDHTYELEQRLAAIRIAPEDSCSFFKVRDGSLIQLHRCLYCTYGAFMLISNSENRHGFCKFKK